MTLSLMNPANAEPQGNRTEPNRLPWPPAFAGVTVIAD
jgi:hypothetical protein